MTKTELKHKKERMKRIIALVKRDGFEFTRIESGCCMECRAEFINGEHSLICSMAENKINHKF